MADTAQFKINLPVSVRDEIQAAASRNRRSMSAEMIHRIVDSSAHPHAVNESPEQMADNLTYKAPQTEEMSRRVYVLPVDLVKRIHAYGYENGHQSEVSAVRELLDAGLAAREVQHD